MFAVRAADLAINVSTLRERGENRLNTRIIEAPTSALLAVPRFCYLRSVSKRTLASRGELNDDGDDRYRSSVGRGAIVTIRRTFVRV